MTNQSFDLSKSSMTIGTEKSGKSEKSERGQWGNQVEFILACVGYAVGLGNVWRFPYLCYENGGGVFLIPYTISLLIAGLPIFYLELAIGQFASLGPNCIFGKLAPIMKGVGWGMITMSFLVAIYYNMIIAWVLFYFVMSFRKDLMWGTCRNDWNTARCHSNIEVANCTRFLGAANDSLVHYFNKTCYFANQTLDYKPLEDQVFKNGVSRVGPAEEFFEIYVMNRSEGFHDIGAPQLKLVLALFAAWVVVYLCLIKGVQSTGKVVYFTATFPYVVLVILMIRGVTLDGASDGIRFYMTPNITKLWEITVWKKAASQIFYSLGPAFGGLLTMASYNKFHNNCFRDAVFVAFTNCGTSVFAGFAIFSVCGFMAKKLGKTVNSVVESGPALAFIAYPEAIVRMPFPPLWAILFFFMLFTLGLDSQFAMVETVSTALLDQFPDLRRHKSKVILGACILMFLGGIPFCTRGGMYIFTLFDNHSAGFCLITIAFFEVITVIHIYGIKDLVADLQVMLGAKDWRLSDLHGLRGWCLVRNTLKFLFAPAGWYWRVAWFGVAPLYLLFILIANFAFYTRTTYGEHYTFPNTAEAAGWIMGFTSVAWVPCLALYEWYKYRKEGRDQMDLLRATSHWCPASERDKTQEIPMKPLPITEKERF